MDHAWNVWRSKVVSACALHRTHIAGRAMHNELKKWCSLFVLLLLMQLRITLNGIIDIPNNNYFSDSVATVDLVFFQ